MDETLTDVKDRELLAELQNELRVHARFSEICSFVVRQMHSAGVPVLIKIIPEEDLEIMQLLVSRNVILVIDVPNVASKPLELDRKVLFETEFKSVSKARKRYLLKACEFLRISN